jgi:hypothetical protein
MAFCRECGAPIDDGVKFCPECGTPAGGDAATPPDEVSPPATSQPVANNATPTKKDGFFSKHVRAGGALKQLEKLFVAYKDHLTGEIYATGTDEFPSFYSGTQPAREQVQAELNRIAGIQ